ncbi:MAG: insulinase family protein [Rhodobacterales bacterium]|nr:insulinase family protein [Rhodobacterales bacterium]
MRGTLSLAPLALLLALTGCPKTTPAPTAEAPVADKYTGPLPVDPNVRTGVLPNGMRYYIEVNQEPKERVVFRLAVDAGSILEDDDQLGLAHVVEHMAFNGSEHFEGNELITYLESVGTKFGAHLNAHTSTDETVYKLVVPTDDPEIVEKAFLVFEDWAGGITFDDEEIEKERGVVLEEWRGGRGVGARLREEMRPLTFHDSKYIDRDTIGTEDSLKNFEPDALRRFYTDWYRPELMAIVVVGDIDPDEMQAKIEAHFSDIQGPETPRERIRPDIPAHAEPFVIVLTDKELPRTGVTITQKHDDVHDGSHEQYKEGTVDSLIMAMFNERLRDLATSPEAPFLGAGAGGGRLTPIEGLTNVGAAAIEGGSLEALGAMLTEIKRVHDHGFTQAELTRAQEINLRGMEDYYNERDTTHSRNAANEIVRVFLTNESMPGVEYEWELAQQWIPSATLEDVNKRAQTEWMLEDSRVYSLTMPEKEGLTPPTKDEVLAVIAEVAASTVSAPEAEAEMGPLFAELPQPGTITEREEISELGFTVWTLSNGVKVWIKPTDFKADEVRMSAVSPGGHAAAGNDDWPAIGTSTTLMTRSGMGDMTALEVNKYLAGKQASVNPWIGGQHEGMSGSASPKDLDTLMELVRGAFTVPRFDEDAFAVYHKQQVAGLENRLSDPDAHYSDAFSALTWGDHARHQPWTVETLGQMDLAKSEAFYKERFADASDFTFVFVGNIDLETFEPLVNQYLATLPTVDREDVQGDDGARRAKGIHTETVRAGVEQKARFGLEFHGDFESTWLTRNRLSAVQDVLSTVLREELREELGGVYGVGVSASSYMLPESTYRFSVGFRCDPERVQELEEATFAVLQRVIDEGVDAHYIDDAKEKNRRARQVSLKTNGFWLGGVAGAIRYDRDPMMMMTYDERNESLTAENVHEMAKLLLNMKQYTKVVLLPEKSAEE